jgi:hypothetical protein
MGALEAMSFTRLGFGDVELGVILDGGGDGDGRFLVAFEPGT